MLQQELLAALRDANPGRRLAASKDGLSVGVWVEAWGRFAVAYASAIDGKWVNMGGVEVLSNGRPPYADGDWQEASPVGVA